MSPSRVSTAVVAAAFALTTAACGGDSGGGASSATPSAAPAPLTSPDATAAAGKINLQTGDLPGYTVSPPDEPDTEEKQAEVAFAQCVGATFIDPFATISSDNFTKGELPSVEVASEVSFVDDAGKVKQDLAAFSSDKTPGCVTTFFKTALGTEEGVTFSEPQVTQLTPQAEGVDGAFGLRLTSSAEAEGQRIPFTFDLLGYGKGRTEVTLLAFGVGTSLQETERDALFATLVERGRDNAL